MELLGDGSEEWQIRGARGVYSSSKIDNHFGFFKVDFEDTLKPDKNVFSFFPKVKNGTGVINCSKGSGVIAHNSNSNSSIWKLKLDWLLQATNFVFIIYSYWKLFVGWWKPFFHSPWLYKLTSRYLSLKAILNR